MKNWSTENDLTLEKNEGKKEGASEDKMFR